MSKVFKFVFKFVLWAVITVVLVLCFGGSLMLMWNWFVVPLGLRPLTFAHAYGLALLARLFIGDAINEIFATLDPQAKEMPAQMKALARATLFLITTGAGWVVSLFM